MPRTADPAVLARVPDEAAWVDTRGILESGRAEVFVAAGGNAARDPLVVTLPWRAVASVVGPAPAALIHEAIASLDGDVNVLAPIAAAEAVAAALPGWTSQVALLHTLEGAPAWLDGQDEEATIFTRATAPDLGHLPPVLREELDRALAGRPATRFVQGRLPADAPLPDARSVPVAASWHEGLPVSFCYAVTETGRWWDVSVETLPAYRRRGLAACAARAMTRLMWSRSKAPVWGAMAENAASRALAGRLGFVETARLAVFTSRR